MLENWGVRMRESHRANEWNFSVDGIEVILYPFLGKKLSEPPHIFETKMLTFAHCA